MPSIQLERKAESIRRYLAHVQKPDLSEYARGVALIDVLKGLLLDANPEFLQEYLAGMEHSLGGPKTALYNRGRVDALYGNLVIEFKRSLSKSLEAKGNSRSILHCSSRNPTNAKGRSLAWSRMESGLWPSLLVSLSMRRA